MILKYSNLSHSLSIPIVQVEIHFNPWMSYQAINLVGISGKKYCFFKECLYIHSNYVDLFKHWIIKNYDYKIKIENGIYMLDNNQELMTNIEVCSVDKIRLSFVSLTNRGWLPSFVGIQDNDVYLDKNFIINSGKYKKIYDDYKSGAKIDIDRSCLIFGMSFRLNPTPSCLEDTVVRASYLFFKKSFDSQVKRLKARFNKPKIRDITTDKEVRLFYHIEIIDRFVSFNLIEFMLSSMKSYQDGFITRSQCWSLINNKYHSLRPINNNLLLTLSFFYLFGPDYPFNHAAGVIKLNEYGKRKTDDIVLNIYADIKILSIIIRNSTSRKLCYITEDVQLSLFWLQLIRCETRSKDSFYNETMHFPYAENSEISELKDSLKTYSTPLSDKEILEYIREKDPNAYNEIIRGNRNNK